MSPEQKSKMAELVDRLAFAIEEDARDQEERNLALKLLQASDRFNKRTLDS